MDKPYTTEIIKLMAEHSDGCAAYASAMKWDWLRRQKIGDVTEDDLRKNCALCKRYALRNWRHIDCFLGKRQGGGSDREGTLRRKIFVAWEAKDQQAFTKNANDLYYLICKIIDDLYKPKPEPKKEVFYKVGDKFVDTEDDSKLVLANVSPQGVALIEYEGSDIGNRNCNCVYVQSRIKITKAEFKQICGSGTFTLIEDEKK